LNPDWATSHAFQPEIEAYWARLNEKYGLSSYITFGCEFVTASWDPTAQLYHITTEDVKTGKQTFTKAHVIISGVGAFHIPKFPDIPGVKDFRGLSFHSSSWMDAELAGKRVAVIGNGSSALVT
jgi:cation diffusion facilitator CzcD-associated flavoprotein CzcO